MSDPGYLAATVAHREAVDRMVFEQRTIRQRQTVERLTAALAYSLGALNIAILSVQNPETAALLRKCVADIKDGHHARGIGGL